MLEVKNLTKRYQNTRPACDDISFTLEDGSINVLLGPNGAGKSTLMKSVAGLLSVEGEIKLDGEDVTTPKCRRQIGYIPELPSFYPNLTVAEHMEFMGRCYRLKNFKEKSNDLLKRFELYEQRKKFGDELSKGMQQKLNICLGLLTEPKLILFDEPFIGLDPHAIKELREIILEKKNEGCIILISTHIIDTINELWDKTIIVKRGHVLKTMLKDEEASSDASLEQIFFDLTETSIDDSDKTSGR